MASTNTMSNHDAIFKEAYADKIVDLRPDNVYLCNQMKPLPTDQQPGGDHVQPVALTSEQGITKEPAGSTSAWALNAPIASASDQAKVTGNQYLLRCAIGYEPMFRSKGKNSFIAMTKFVIENAIKSQYFYMEADLWWGRNSKAVIDSVSGNTFTIQSAEFAPALWLASENRSLAFQSGSTRLGTASISSYDISNKTLTVDSLPTGCGSGTTVWFAADGIDGAKCPYGLYDMANSSTTSLFDIDGSSYNMWLPASSYDMGGAISFANIMASLRESINKGLGDDINEIDYFLHPRAWEVLGNDEAALREYDTSFKPNMAMRGVENIQFRCQAGIINIIPTKFMKEGYAIIAPKVSRSCSLIGPQPKPTFDLPGCVKKDSNYFITLTENAGVETRLYSIMAPFSTKRHQMRTVSGITYS